MTNLHILVILLTMSVPSSPHSPPPPIPPPPPAIPPATFFTFANNIPVGLYSSYMCGVFNQPENGAAAATTTPGQVIYDQRLALLSQWLSSVNTTTASPASAVRSGGFNPFFSSDNRTVVLKALRSKLVSGVSRKQLGQLRAILVQNLTSGDLELTSAMVYHTRHNLAMGAAEMAQIFFVQDPSSTSRLLTEGDKRKLLAEIILAANGRGPCDDCPVNFQTKEDIVRAVYRNVLPSGLSSQQITDAESGMVYLSIANFSRQDTANIVANFVHDMMSSDPYQDLNTYRQRSLAHLGRKKRSYYNHTRFDHNAACRALHNFAHSSRYCGVRASAEYVKDFVF
ncbi:hypothetical protein Btru_051234 [Bulinus truncatus]|nr:hypothetical protein Btru_051234 [Bulinus truncatus]